MEGDPTDGFETQPKQIQARVETGLFVEDGTHRQQQQCEAIVCEMEKEHGRLEEENQIGQFGPFSGLSGQQQCFGVRQHCLGQSGSSSGEDHGASTFKLGIVLL